MPLNKEIKPNPKSVVISGSKVKMHNVKIITIRMEYLKLLLCADYLY